MRVPREDVKSLEARDKSRRKLAKLSKVGLHWHHAIQQRSVKIKLEVMNHFKGPSVVTDV